MQKQLVLWDFDGTLANTLGLALTTYNGLAQRYGFRPIDDPQAVRNLSMQEFLAAHEIPRWRVPGLFASFLKSMQTATQSISLFDGVAEAVRELREAGFRHGIVSSNSATNIRRCLEHNSADDLFDDVCGTSRLFGKGHRIRSALKQLAVAPNQCLYLGDEVRDIEAASAAGVAVGCVGWGLNSPELLRRHSPVFLAETTAELSPLIGGFFAAEPG